RAGPRGSARSLEGRDDLARRPRRRGGGPQAPEAAFLGEHRLRLHGAGMGFGFSPLPAFVTLGVSRCGRPAALSARPGVMDAAAVYDASGPLNGGARQVSRVRSPSIG